MTDTNTSETKQLRPVDEVRHTLTRMQDQFRAALPPQVPAERFVRIAITAVQQNLELLAADRQTLYAACMKCAQDGLLPDGREAVLQVYNTNVAKKGEAPRYQKRVQYMPMIEGLMKHVRNSGEIANWSVQVVKQNDVFEYELGDAERIIHKPQMKDRGPTIAAYSIVTFKNGERSREVMDIDQLEGIRKRSKQPDSGPWKTDTDEMNRKTVARRHYKRLPKSSDLDGFMERVDDLYDLDQSKSAQIEATEQAPAMPAPKGRPKGLQHVVDAVPTAQMPTAQREQAPVAAAAVEAESENPADGVDDVI